MPRGILDSGPGVEVQHEGGADGGGQEPLQVGPARHAVDEDLHRGDSYHVDTARHVRSKPYLEFGGCSQDASLE